LTTKKHAGSTQDDAARPRIKSSHEKGLDTRARAKTKSTREAPRAGLSERARGLRRSRAAHDAPVPTADGVWSVASDAARETATLIAIAALDKKAVGVEILDVAGRVDYADFLVIMTGRSDRHAQALAQGIEDALKKRGVRPVAVEGLPHGTWVLMDFGDVVVHVFQDEARQLYDLEGLWLDARRLPVPADPAQGD
jgi:ribosome-associated protein